MMFGSLLLSLNTADIPTMYRRPPITCAVIVMIKSSVRKFAMARRLSINDVVQSTKYAVREIRKIRMYESMNESSSLIAAIQSGALMAAA